MIDIIALFYDFDDFCLTYSTIVIMSRNFMLIFTLAIVCYDRKEVCVIFDSCALILNKMNHIHQRIIAQDIRYTA